MKKIATITTHAALNPGAVLQAYALSRYINDAGYDCEILNYVPPHVDESYALITRPKSIKGLCLSAFQILHYQARKKRKDRFEAFRGEYLPLSGAKLRTHQELIEAANHYDTVIMGSDQIWNPDLHQFDEGYFLSFPEVNARCVSYAASFGQDTVNESLAPELTRRLSGISRFACREYSGQQLIRRLTGKEACMVLDPVFLLDPGDWKKIAKPIAQKAPYVLACFYSNPGKSPAAIRKYAKKSGREILSIGFLPSDISHGMHHNYSLGPREFLGAIASADCVATNSFHCTAFSILMEKPFYTRISEQKNSRNDRMVSLLKDLGLEDRLYCDRDADKLDFRKPIDYYSVKKRMAERIAASREYLIHVLES